MMNLPDDLIIPILMRLPIKSLLRFRCVSKLWFSLISDPHFATSHFELAAARTDRLLYLPSSAYASQTRSIDLHASLHTDSASVTINPSFSASTSYLQIMGSCRGFILLLSRYSDLYVWNPSTNVYKPLSLSPVALNMNLSVYPSLYGFGYNPSTDDYMVVQASYNPEIELETCIELFSLRANAWKRIEGTHLSYVNPSDDPRAGMLLNGVIHWLAVRHDVSLYLYVIFAFDLIQGICSELPLPNDFNQDLFISGYLCVLEGFLSLCVNGDGRNIDIWVMKEYKVQASWTKFIVVSLDGLPTLYFYPICSTKSGDIVGMDELTGLMKCNAKGQLLEHRSYCDDLYSCVAAMYTESLLSLPLDSGQATED